MDELIGNIYTIQIKGKCLTVVYDKRRDGLYNYFSSDERIEDFIHKNLEEAFNLAIEVLDEEHFVLNIASTQDLGAIKWSREKVFLNKQLEMFQSIIQKFIIDVISI